MPGDSARQAGAHQLGEIEITEEMKTRVLVLLEESGLIDHPISADRALAERLCRAVLLCLRPST